MPELKLGPRYRVLGPLASGGMGSVILALRRDGAELTPVAIKQLHAHLEHDPEMVAMFLDEARIASRVAHENVVRVEDVEMIGEHLVLVMEYVEGASLATIISSLRRDGKTLPIPAARRIVCDVLHGLHAAHELRDSDGTPFGLVHRDVSPHNVLVGVDGVARVADFGVARASGRLAQTRTGGGVKGKLQYLSPEQVNRKPVDRRADIFSVGSVLWECLTGRRLFSGESEGETLAMILREPIPPPSTIRLEVPIELDEVCLRALERDPSRRFATARELAGALEEGELASRREVGAIVEEWADEDLDRPRDLLLHAMSGRGRNFEEETETRALVVAPPRAAASRPYLAPGMLVAGLVLGGAIVWVSTASSRNGPIATPPIAPSVEVRPTEATTAITPASATSPTPAASIELEEDPPPVITTPTTTSKTTARPPRGPAPPPIGSRKKEPPHPPDSKKPWMPSEP